MLHSYFIYILCSSRHGALYIGFTNNLKRRVFEHKNDLVPGFSREHSTHTLVYFEETDDVQSALLREKQLKVWKRSWKTRLIEETNPEWKDLFITI